MLKKWSRLTKTVEVGVLFRSRENFGLGITPVVDHYERMQLIKCQLLKNSVSTETRKIFEAKVERESKPGRMWRNTKFETKVESEVNLKCLFPTQPTRQGLGAGNFNANPSKPEKRKLISATATSFAEELRLVHSHKLAMQGVWLGWKEKASPFDFSWRNLLYKLSPHLARFILHASVNWVRTPDLLKLWSLVPDASCRLCDASRCTIHHILVGCKFALHDTRYSWRHDSVLRSIQISLCQHIEDRNSTRSTSHVPTIMSSFVRAGEKPRVGKKDRRCWLDGFNDWKCLVDFSSKNIVFPPDVWATDQRPDIVVWSVSAKQVFIIELTCPAEEGICNAATRKEVRYDELKNDINNKTVWYARVVTIEVGARGFVGFSLRRFLRNMGFKPRANSKLCKDVSNVAARCSFAIYLASSSVQWDRTTPLLMPAEVKQHH
jgi:hypothetical protein